MPNHPKLYTLWQRLDGGEWKPVHVNDKAKIDAAHASLRKYVLNSGIENHEAVVLPAAERPEG